VTSAGPAPQTALPPDSWEAVLAAVEADVNRTEQLLGPTVTQPAPALAPAELMLPVAEDPVLPPFAQMPPVPPELVERITELRARIVELRADLERCLAAARRTEQLTARAHPGSALGLHLGAPAVEQPHFVDRRA
jgi:hypothetical protein